MKPFMTVLKVGIASLALLALFSSSIAQAAAQVSVKVYAQHVGSKVVYYYRVINNSTEEIASVWIGHDDQNDVWELNELPSGWDFDAGIPPNSATSPPDWKVYVITPQETATHAIAWEVIDNNVPRPQPGQTLTGLSVVLDKADDRYRTSHATVNLSGSHTVTVPLEPDDSAPPILSVTVSPTRLQVTAGKLVTVTATITATDNYDPQPEIKLESITANEPLAAGDITGAALGTDDRRFQLRDVKVPKGATGRIYTITYSATDASGNKAMASATVAVK